ncbi:MAG: hypothetical protein KBC43_12640 [Bacteroidales bacterium]|nr:hypothetical protein [Bacteroidales bacterium]
MKLGITVIYFAKKREGWMIRVHLTFIRKNTNVPYKIYAGTERLLPEFRKKLDGDDIIVCPLSPTNEIAGKENSFYLEQLFRYAIQDGCTHIAVFHVDSFPVRPDWVNYLLNKLDEGYQLAAIERCEELDYKPHSSFMFFSTGYYVKYHPSLRLSEEERKEKSYRKYLKAYPHIPDTGSGFGYQLFKDNLSWYRMQRSNTRQDHRLFAGIYDDLVFHLGAAGFTMSVTNYDRLRYERRKETFRKILKKFSFIFPNHNTIVNKIFAEFDQSGYKLRKSNFHNKIKKSIKIRLGADPDLFINSLRMK